MIFVSRSLVSCGCVLEHKCDFFCVGDRLYMFGGLSQENWPGKNDINDNDFDDHHHLQYRHHHDDIGDIAIAIMMMMIILMMMSMMMMKLSSL